MNKRFLSLVFCLCCCLPAGSQRADTSLADSQVQEETPEEADEPEAASPPEKQVLYNSSSPNPDQWGKETNRKEYAYKNETEYQPSKAPLNPAAKPYELPWYVKAVDAVLQFLAQGAGRIFLWAVLALLAGYVLYQIIAGQAGRMFRRKDFGKQEEDPNPLSEEDLLGQDWEERLRLALAVQDHRQAIRYSYLFLLQLLQRRGLIDYRNDKTNSTYFLELGRSNTGMAASFRQLSRQYEYAWYGNLSPHPAVYESFQVTFNGIKNQLQGS